MIIHLVGGIPKISLKKYHKWLKIKIKNKDSWNINYGTYFGTSTLHPAHTVGFEVRMRLKRQTSTTAHWMEKATSTGEWCSPLSTFLQSRSWLLGRKSTSTVWARLWCQWPLASPCSCGTTTSSHLTISLVSSEENSGDGGQRKASSALPSPPPLPLLYHLSLPFTPFCHPPFFLPSYVLSSCPSPLSSLISHS